MRRLITLDYLEVSNSRARCGKTAAKKTKCGFRKGSTIIEHLSLKPLEHWAERCGQVHAKLWVKFTNANQLVEFTSANQFDEFANVVE